MGVSHWSVRLARAGGQHRAKFGLLKESLGPLGIGTICGVVRQRCFGESDTGV